MSRFGRGVKVDLALTTIRVFTPRPNFSLTRALTLPYPILYLRIAKGDFWSGSEYPSRCYNEMDIYDPTKFSSNFSLIFFNVQIWSGRKSWYRSNNDTRFYAPTKFLLDSRFDLTLSYIYAPTSIVHKRELLKVIFGRGVNIHLVVTTGWIFTTRPNFHQIFL